MYNANFRKLLALVPRLNEIEFSIIKIPANTALHVEVLYRFGSTVILSLSQYGEHPLGGVVADPSMIVAAYAETATVEALTFQNYLGIRRVYFDGIAGAADISKKSSMNQFLGHWLANLLAEREAANIRTNMSFRRELPSPICAGKELTGPPAIRKITLLLP
jgi:uncharacterized protein YqiB (DUF1249 family)